MEIGDGSSVNSISTNVVRDRNIVRETQSTSRKKRKCNKSLRCMTLNAQSLQYKMSELEKRAKLSKPYIISITESWGKDNIDDIVYNLDDYNMYRNDRIGRAGSGTLLYIRKNLGQRKCKAMATLMNGQEYDSSVWVWVNISKGKKILVGSIYRSPNSSADNNKLLLAMLDHANDIAGENRLLILGDFNVPNIDWIERETLPGARIIERHFFESITDNFLHQHVTVPTRYRGTQSSTLDLIFTKEEDDLKNVEALPPIGGSDHAVVIGDFICEWKSRAEPKKRRAYFRGNYDNYNTKLRLTNWAHKLSSNSAKTNWENYREIENTLTNENIPLSSPKDYNEPWMNRKVLRLWKKKYHAWKRVTEMNTDTRWRQYRKERDKLKKQIRTAKRTYEKNIAQEARHNKRAFFKYVNSKLTVRPEITQIKRDDGSFAESDKEIGDAIVNYFSSVQSPYHTGPLPEMQHMTQNQIGEINITPKVVEDKLIKLNVHKSSGPDNIHPCVLQKTAKEMSIPLAHIFQQSLDSGEVPDDWRTANVTPIHKKGDRTDPSNYRPVSLTSQVCKVLESIIRDKIVEHLESNNLLNEAQHGFRKGRSCLTNILETLEQWTKILDEGDGVDVAYLDFRKAFDLVSHELLIHKMTKYGISGQILEWVRNFLHNRTQKVVIRGTASEAVKVTSGVPQGSVLGPILFLIFINDLPTKVISPISLFADDSKIFSRITTKKRVAARAPNGNEILQKDLDEIQEWAKTWKMEFNVSKCKIMHLGYNNPKNDYNMNNTNLEETELEKDLGVLIDCRLEFDKHIKSIVGKANRMLGLIKFSFTCMNKSMFLHLYKGLVRPLLEYCVQAWSPYKKKHIDLIEGVQKRAIRLVPELRNMSYEKQLEELNLTELVDRRLRGDMIETFKIITGKESLNPQTFFQMARNTRARNGTHSMKIFKEYSRLDLRKFTFSQRVALPWNRLTSEEVHASKTSDFKASYGKLEAERVKKRKEDIYFWG